MVISSVSALSANVNNTKSINANPTYKTNANYSDSTSFKSETNNDEKKDEIKKQVKKVYYKGLFTGVGLTTLLCIGDYLLDYFIDDKNADKICKSLDFSCFEDGKEIKNTAKATSEMRIPFINTIKKILSKIKK